MFEEIVIKTETVRIDELNEREKQIYDYAFKKGSDQEKEFRKDRPFRILMACIFCFFSGIAIGIFRANY